MNKNKFGLIVNIINTITVEIREYQAFNAILNYYNLTKWKKLLYSSYNNLELMLSYLSNRHYHTLTQLLPPQLRGSQPQKIYYRTFIDNDTLKLMQQNKKVTHKTLAANSNRKPLTRKKTINASITKLNACPICYQTHIAVQYHGHCHICVKCRSFVRDQYGNQIKIFLDQNGDIICLGILPKSFERSKVGYYVTDHTKLQVSNTGVYATFAGQNQLVLILKQKQQVK